jgi:exonuclease III
LVEDVVLSNQIEILLLQETRNYGGAGGLRIAGLRGFEVLASSESSGLYIGVRKGVEASVLFASGELLIVRIIRGDQTLVVGNVHFRKGLNRASADLVHEWIEKLRRRDKEALLMVGGDFNCERGRLEREIGGIRVIDQKEPFFTRFPLCADREPSTIDHFATVRGQEACFSETWTLDDGCMVSDHAPILVAVKGFVKVDDKKLKRQMIREVVKDNREYIVDSNHWAPLREALDHGESIDAIAASFNGAVEKIVEEVGAYSVPVEGRLIRVHKLSRQTRKLVVNAKKLFNVARNSTVTTKGEALRAYLEARKAARDGVERDDRAEWDNKIAKAMELFRSKKSKAGWRWAKSLVDARADLTEVHPVRNKSGTVVRGLTEIVDIWVDHYSELAKDKNGYVDPIRYWKKRSSCIPQQQPVVGVNGPFSWVEISGVLASFANGKAAGVDDIPAEFLKLALSEDARPNVLSRCLTDLCNVVLERSAIPMIWNKSVVVSIPKKGCDKLDCNSYRGISLMPVTLKLVCAMISRRLSGALERRGDLVPEQGGFRRGEECAGQVVALYEILNTRRHEGQRTYTCFVDFRKAYDTVPHEALFRKLMKLGVNGDCLRFIRELYASSNISVRVGSKAYGSIPLRRGLRQGCPLSPLLFDVYINDLIHDLGAKHGIAVRGVERTTSGLLFADDLTLLAKSKSGLRKLIGRVGGMGQPVATGDRTQKMCRDGFWG